MIASGGTPNLAFTPSASSVSGGLAIVLIRVTRSVTSCARSLSPVEITTRWPLPAPMRASVPIASSASMPGTSSTGQPSRRTTSWIGAIWARRSSGIGARLALYSGYHASRKVGPGASNTQAAWPAPTWPRSHFIIATKPWIAPVGKPSGERRSGSAW